MSLSRLQEGPVLEPYCSPPPGGDEQDPCQSQTLAYLKVTVSDVYLRGLHSTPQCSDASALSLVSALFEWLKLPVIAALTHSNACCVELWPLLSDF